MAKKKNYSKKGKSRSKKTYSTKERKAYWMGVGAGEVARENDSVHNIPTWKVKDLGPKAVDSYYAGFKKKYRSFD